MIDMSPSIRLLTKSIGVGMDDIAGIVRADSGILSDIGDDGCVKTSIHQNRCMNRMINSIGYTTDVDSFWIRNCYGWCFDSVYERPSSVISCTIPIAVCIGLGSRTIVDLGVDFWFSIGLYNTVTSIFHKRKEDRIRRGHRLAINGSGSIYGTNAKC